MKRTVRQTFGHPIERLDIEPVPGGGTLWRFVMRQGPPVELRFYLDPPEAQQIEKLKQETMAGLDAGWICPFDLEGSRKEGAV